VNTLIIFKKFLCWETGCYRDKNEEDEVAQAKEKHFKNFVDW